VSGAKARSLQTFRVFFSRAGLFSALLSCGCGLSQLDGLTGGVDGSGGVTGVTLGLDGTYRIVAKNSGRCLDGSALPSAVGRSILQQGCLADAEQSYTLTYVDDAYTIALTGGTDCIEFASDSNVNGSPLVRLPCAGTTYQRWLAFAQSDGSYQIANRITRKCLDVTAGSSQNGAALQEWECTAGDNQRFWLGSLSAEPLPLLVDDRFVAAPWGNALNGNATMSPSSPADSADCDGNRAPNGRGKCHAVTFSVPSDASVGGFAWLYPADNIGLRPGLAVAAGATAIRFAARGAQGGETIGFQAGGIGSFGSEPIQDTFAIPTTTIVLTTDWQSYSLDMSKNHYAAGVLGAFGWQVGATGNGAPVQFFLDDIVWE